MPTPNSSTAPVMREIVTRSGATVQSPYTDASARRAFARRVETGEIVGSFASRLAGIYATSFCLLLVVVVAVVTAVASVLSDGEL